MLKKLIAYDFRSVRKTAFMLFAISFSLAIAASVLWAVSMNSFYDLVVVEEPPTGPIITTLGGFFAAFFVTLGAVASASGVIFTIGIHYYKKFVSDEAYLTFTLPATPGQHLASKLITGGVWMGASFLLLIVEAIMIYSSVIMSIFDLSNLNSAEPLPYEPISASDTGMIIAMLIGYLLMAIMATITQISLLYLSLTIGGIVANKNKALAGVGIYFVAEFVIEGIIQGITAVLSVSGMLIMGKMGMTLLPYIGVLIYGGAAVGMMLYTKHLLTHKLNLA